jgi:hypothetical protein
MTLWVSCRGAISSSIAVIFSWVSGNFSTTAALKKVLKFNSWLATVDAATKLVVAGNHNAILEKIGKAETQRFLSNSIYFENEELPSTT